MAKLTFLGSFKAINAQKRKMPAFILLAGLFFFLFLIQPPVVTTSKSSNRNIAKEQADLQQRMKKLRSVLSKKKREEMGIANVVRQVDMERERTGRALDQKTRDLKRAQAQEVYYQKKLDEATQKFSDYRGKYKSRIISYYKNSHAGYIEVLFNSSSFSDFISRLAYLRIITKSDLGILDELKSIQNEVATRRKQVEQSRIEIENDRTKLAQEKTYYTYIYHEKSKALASARQDRKELEAEYAALERENQLIQQELRKMKGGYQHAFSGSFGSPVCGNPFVVTSSFGYRKAPKRGASSNHHGIDLRASYASNICAAADGIVIEARYRNGYGNTVMISHGKSNGRQVVTLYGHGLRFLVGKGEFVRRGQVIMLADSTGTSTGNHLHFEVRIDGVAVNPLR